MSAPDQRTWRTHIHRVLGRCDVSSYRLLLIAVTFSAALIASRAMGQTITVDSSSASSDFGGAQTVQQLPGADGRTTFHEAVIAANNTPGPQTIAFAIPMAEYDTIFDAFMVHLPDYTLPITDGGTTIDGTTQTDFSGDINPDSAEIGFYGEHPNSSGIPALRIFSNDNVITGIGRIRWRGTMAVIEGDRNVVQACTLFGAFYSAVEILGHDNVIGGTGPGEGNTLSSGSDGVRIIGPASGNVIVGNPMITGSDHAVHVQFGALDNRIGGALPGEGNVISGAGHSGEQGFPVGGQILIDGSDGTIVQGNIIGLDETGTVDITASGSFGVQLRSASRSLIGGPEPDAGNVIAGHAGPFATRYGIRVVNDSHDNVIQGNTIGTDVTGTVPIPNEVGIEFWITSGLESLPHDNAVLGNAISHHLFNGVSVIGDTTGIRISGNAIANNGERGIDLTAATEIPFGVSVNDPFDQDTGPNGYQNYPVLSSAVSVPGGVAVTGTLATTPDATFTVELFASATADPTGHGEGEHFLGWLDVTSDALGEAPFVTSLVGAVAPGEVVTATATDGNGNTSEFSAAETIVGGVAWVDLGLGLAGTNGTPALTGDGVPAPGSPVTLTVTDARPLAPTALIVGAGMLAAPFKGGTLVPSPDLVVTGLATDAGGGLSLTGPWPAGLQAGVGVVMQMWIDDSFGPQGWSATNALAVTGT